MNAITRLGKEIKVGNGDAAATTFSDGTVLLGFSIPGIRLSLYMSREEAAALAGELLADQIIKGNADLVPAQHAYLTPQPGDRL